MGPLEICTLHEVMDVQVCRNFVMASSTFQSNCVTTSTWCVLLVWKLQLGSGIIVELPHLWQQNFEHKNYCSEVICYYEGHTESHEQCRIVGNSATSNDWLSFGSWHQLLPYLWVRYCVSSLHHVTINKWYKMADNDVLYHQCAVIEFHVKEEIPAADIHYRLRRVYGHVCMGASSVRWWVKHFKNGNMSIQDQPRSGRPWTGSPEANKKIVDEIINKDRRVTLDAVATKLEIGHNAVQEMIGGLGYRKTCARWVSRLLTEDHKV
jgi:transposase